MKRRTVINGLAAAVAGTATGVGSTGAAHATSTAGQRTATTRAGLTFDPDAYTTLTATIATGGGPKTVTYRFYRAVPYVAAPVDVTYQSLNVSVPVAIDGAPVDATSAPILLANAIGGYMPSTVVNNTGVGTFGNSGLALAAGFVVVEPGARGRTLVGADGVYYGVAPAAIVDLKAAVRYVRLNHGRLPGDSRRIISSGTSAGGALSTLLAASGDSPLYARELAAIGAAPGSDAILAAAAYCPITDLDHADAAYEWCWGALPDPRVDPVISAELAAQFPGYLASLHLRGGSLNAGNYTEYLLRTFLEPAATAFLAALPEADRAAYLAAHPAIGWSDGRASFGWDDFVAHVGTRRKGAPAFDTLDLASPENNLFGRGTVRARHFTRYSLRKATGDPAAQLDPDLPLTLTMMNPMPFLQDRNPGRARHWWLRVGTKDTDSTPVIVGNLAANLRDLGDDVNAAMYWDAGHGANLDADAFIAWAARLGQKA